MNQACTEQDVLRLHKTVARDPFLFLSITNLLKRIIQERMKIGSNIFLLTVQARRVDSVVKRTSEALKVNIALPHRVK